MSEEVQGDLMANVGFSLHNVQNDHKIKSAAQECYIYLKQTGTKYKICQVEIPFNLYWWQGEWHRIALQVGSKIWKQVIFQNIWELLIQRSKRSMTDAKNPRKEDFPPAENSWLCREPGEHTEWGINKQHVLRVWKWSVVIRWDKNCFIPWIS